MRAENFDIEIIIDSLRGTCNTLDETINSIYPGMEYEDLTDEDHEEIDNNIFCCETCGWWTDVSEMSEENERCCAEHDNE